MVRARKAPTLRTWPLMIAEQPVPPAGEEVTHYVTDEEMARPTPRALCGRTFRPACLLTPLGPVCPACLAALPGAGGPRRRRRLLALLVRRKR